MPDRCWPGLIVFLSVVTSFLLLSPATLHTYLFLCRLHNFQRPTDEGHVFVQRRSHPILDISTRPPFVILHCCASFFFSSNYCNRSRPHIRCLVFVLTHQRTLTDSTFTAYPRCRFFLFELKYGKPSPFPRVKVK